MLAIRISRSYDEIHDWCEGLTSEKLIVYEHVGDNSVKRSHCHLLVIGAILKPDAMKARFKKLYGDILKTDWSFKTADAQYDTYITYMSKGHLLPMLTRI